MPQNHSILKVHKVGCGNGTRLAWTKNNLNSGYYGIEASTQAVEQACKNCKGVQSYKKDYRTLFTWHPHFECMSHKIKNHGEKSYTDNHDDWVAVSVLRKHQNKNT
jgi:hypothetical protein